MMFRKRSFFERLTGVTDDDASVSSSTHIYESQETPIRNTLPSREFLHTESGRRNYAYPPSAPVRNAVEELNTDAEGQLAVDVYQTRTEIIVQTMVAGVRPDDLNISITHEKVTIAGRREGPHGIPPEDYFHNELYWGNFSRTIHLPQEVEPEVAEAIEKHGLLILRLTKVDKERQHKIKIKQL